MYLSAPFYLDLKPEEVMMCAATSAICKRPQLWSAYGLHLPSERVWRRSYRVPDKAKPGDFDVVSAEHRRLGHQLGA